MKKRTRRLDLNRETLLHLHPGKLQAAIQDTQNLGGVPFILNRCPGIDSPYPGIDNMGPPISTDLLTAVEGPP